MKTMIELSTEFVDKNGPQMFEAIWEVVQKEMKDKWIAKSTKGEKRTLESKKAELFTLLTISGQFIRTKRNEFGLVTQFSLEEVRKMKLKVGELDD